MLGGGPIPGLPEEEDRRHRLSVKGQHSDPDHSRELKRRWGGGKWGSFGRWGRWGNSARAKRALEAEERALREIRCSSRQRPDDGAKQPARKGRQETHRERNERRRRAKGNRVGLPADGDADYQVIAAFEEDLENRRRAARMPSCPGLENGDKQGREGGEKMTRTAAWSERFSATAPRSTRESKDAAAPISVVTVEEPTG